MLKKKVTKFKVMIKKLEIVYMIVLYKVIKSIIVYKIKQKHVWYSKN